MASNKTVFFIIGILLIILGLFMLVPRIYSSPSPSASSGSRAPRHFLTTSSAIISGRARSCSRLPRWRRSVYRFRLKGLFGPNTNFQFGYWHWTGHVILIWLLKMPKEQTFHLMIGERNI